MKDRSLKGLRGSVAATKEDLPHRHITVETFQSTDGFPDLLHIGPRPGENSTAVVICV